MTLSRQSIIITKNTLHSLGVCPNNNNNNKIQYLEIFKFCVRVHDQDTILMFFFVLSMVNSVRLINKKWTILKSKPFDGRNNSYSPKLYFACDTIPMSFSGSLEFAGLCHGGFSLSLFTDCDLQKKSRTFVKLRFILTWKFLKKWPAYSWNRVN